MKKINVLGFIVKEAAISTQKAGAIVDDIAQFFHYEPTIMDEKGEMIENPVSVLDFANQKILEQIKSFVNEARKQRAEKAMSYEKLEL